MADLVALFLTGFVPGLRLGRAQFSRIEAWLNRPLPAPDLVIMPQRQYIENLYLRLRPLVLAEAPEREWLPLMRMFRNKAAHLGDSVFRYVGLSDNTGKVYTFVPRQWPYIWEEHMHPAGTTGTAHSIPDLLLESLVHDDIISYACGVRSRITRLVGAVVEIIDSAYVAFKDFKTNETALAELKKSSEAFKFRYFLA